MRKLIEAAGAPAEIRERMVPGRRLNTRGQPYLSFPRVSFGRKC